ncbi:MAG TPA: hypothetical protein DCE39_17015, partial [Planctomycetaceae bacterium]|nr:hypothetical protein [Planctomycetaceae bacterium]
MGAKERSVRCPLGLKAPGCLLALVLLACVGAACSDSPESEPPGGRDNAAAAPSGKTPSGLEKVEPAIQTVARFVDRAGDAGVDFSYRNGQDAGYYSIVESLGGGIGLLDWDRDGDVDLFLPGGGKFGPEQTIDGHPSGVFLNRGGWSFLPVAREAGTAGVATRYSHGAAVGDFDDDGFPDVLVTGYGGL